MACTPCVPTCPETPRRGPCPPPAPPVLSQRVVRTYPRPPLRGIRWSRARPLLAPLPLLSCTPPALRTTRPSHRAADFAAGSHVSEHRLRTLCFRSSPPAGPYTARATSVLIHAQPTFVRLSPSVCHTMHTCLRCGSAAPTHCAHSMGYIDTAGHAPGPLSGRFRGSPQRLSAVTDNRCP